MNELEINLMLGNFKLVENTGKRTTDEMIKDLQSIKTEKVVRTNNYHEINIVRA